MFDREPMKCMLHMTDSVNEVQDWSDQIFLFLLSGLQFITIQQMQF